MPDKQVNHPFWILKQRCMFGDRKCMQAFEISSIQGLMKLLMWLDNSCIGFYNDLMLHNTCTSSCQVIICGLPLTTNQSWMWAQGLKFQASLHLPCT